MVKFLVRAGLWIALVLSLLGSVDHVAWAFSTLHGGNMARGYVQAVAVDVGLAALAVGIQVRRRSNRPTVRLWVGVIMFAASSIYANLLHGFGHTTALVLTGAPAWLESWRPYLLSAILPVMVIYLSEIASEDERAHAESKTAAPSKSGSNGAHPTPISPDLHKLENGNPATNIPVPMVPPGHGS